MWRNAVVGITAVLLATCPWAESVPSVADRVYDRCLENPLETIIITTKVGKPAKVTYYKSYSFWEQRFGARLGNGIEFMLTNQYGSGKRYEVPDVHVGSLFICFGSLTWPVMNGGGLGEPIFRVDATKG